MELGEKIAEQRKKKGITQQQLAELTGLTVRTIQRIENGQSIPRAFTITAIAEALGTTFQTFHPQDQVEPKADKETHFLQMLTLSCFCYLLIPIIHFLVPMYLLRKSEIKDEVTLNLARATIRIQIIWSIATNGIMLATLAFNFISAIYFNRVFLINFLSPFFLMYAINAFLLTSNFIRIKRL